MGMKRTWTYTCDRCGEVVEKDNQENQPHHWSRLMLTRPPLANPLEVVHADKVEAMICDYCSRVLKSWLVENGTLEA